NFYPYAEKWPYRPPTGAVGEAPFPAVEVELDTKLGTRPDGPAKLLLERWVSGLPFDLPEDPEALPRAFARYLARRAEERDGREPIELEFFSTRSPTQVREFVSPPPPRDLG